MRRMEEATENEVAKKAGLGTELHEVDSSKEDGIVD